MKLVCGRHNKCCFFSSPLFGRCDRGFGGPYCVPVVPLPSILKDDFNGNLHPDLWPEVYGAERGNLNGETIKSGTSLIFKGVSEVLHAPLSPLSRAAHTHASLVLSACYFIHSCCLLGHTPFRSVSAFAFPLFILPPPLPPRFCLVSEVRSCCVCYIHFRDPLDPASSLCFGDWSLLTFCWNP